VTYATQADGRSTGRITAVAVLAVIAVAAIVAAILYFAEPAKSLPSFMGTITHPASRATAHRTTRGAVALAVGVVFLVAAGLATRMGRSSSR
jgi:multisubunit Na+/H+ antiporter MnhB subunit